jgi:uncharacterized protein (TIGR00251 family)
VSSIKYHLHGGKKGSALAIRVTPRASRNEIVGILNDGTVKIHLTSPPVDGKANKALVEFLADVLGISVSRIDIVGGFNGRDKLVSILDMEVETVQERILNKLS